MEIVTGLVTGWVALLVGVGCFGAALFMFSRDLVDLREEFEGLETGLVLTNSVIDEDKRYVDKLAKQVNDSTAEDKIAILSDSLVQLEGEMQQLRKQLEDKADRRKVWDNIWSINADLSGFDHRITDLETFNAEREALIRESIDSAAPLTLQESMPTPIPDPTETPEPTESPTNTCTPTPTYVRTQNSRHCLPPWFWVILE